MAVEFFDGFEAYGGGGNEANTLLGDRWTSRVTDGTYLSNSSPRTGTYKAQVGANSTNDYYDKTGMTARARRIFGFAFQINSLLSNVIFFKVMDGTTNHVYLRFNTDGSIGVYNGDNTLLGTSATGLIAAANTFYYIELDVTIDDSVGAIIVRHNESAVITLTNQDTRNGGNSTCDGFRLNCNVSSRVTGFDDLYVVNPSASPNTGFLGAIKIYPILPTSTGNTNQLTNQLGSTINAYQSIDEIPPNGDTDYVESSTVGEKSTYGMGDIAPLTGSILAIQTIDYAKKTDAGTRQIAPVTRSSGSDYDGTTRTLTASYAYYTEIREVDPATSAQWAIAAVNAIESGVKVIA